MLLQTAPLAALVKNPWPSLVSLESFWVTVTILGPCRVRSQWMNDIYFCKQNGCGMGVVSYYGCDMWVWHVGVASVLDPALKKLEPTCMHIIILCILSRLDVYR